MGIDDCAATNPKSDCLRRALDTVKAEAAAKGDLTPEQFQRKMQSSIDTVFAEVSTQLELDLSCEKAVSKYEGLQLDCMESAAALVQWSYGMCHTRQHAEHQSLCTRYLRQIAGGWQWKILARAWHTFTLNWQTEKAVSESALMLMELQTSVMEMEADTQQLRDELCANRLYMKEQHERQKQDTVIKKGESIQ